MGRILLSLGFASMLAASATADMVTLRESAVAPSVQVVLYGKNFTGGMGAVAGTTQFSFLGSDAGIPGWGYCIEMQYSPSTYQTYSVVSLEAAPLNQGPGGQPMGTTKADYIAELWAAHIGDTSSAVGAAAFQAAIWEIVYEDAQAWNVITRNEANKSNSFKIGMITGGDAATFSAVTSLANSWLGGLTGQGPRADLLALSNNSYQDYVVQVPVPAGIALAGLGLALVYRFGRRKGSLSQ